jgi:hypothetical protein
VIEVDEPTKRYAETPAVHGPTLAARHAPVTGPSAPARAGRVPPGRIGEVGARLDRFPVTMTRSRRVRAALVALGRDL